LAEAGKTDDAQCCLSIETEEGSLDGIAPRVIRVGNPGKPLFAKDRVAVYAKIGKPDEVVPSVERLPRNCDPERRKYGFAVEAQTGDFNYVACIVVFEPQSGIACRAEGRLAVNTEKSRLTTLPLGS